MIELVLTIAIISLLSYHAYSEKLHKEREEKLINAVIAKNAQDMRDLEIAENTKINVEPPTPPDLQPLESLSNEEHMKAILNQMKGDEE